MVIGFPLDGAYCVAGTRPQSNPGIAMTLRLLLLLLLAPVLAAAAQAAEPEAGEPAMVKLCQSELEPRLFGGGAHGDAFIAAQSTERTGERVVIHLDLASGEGRRISGSCIFRDGKLFDVK
jgi:hypothetical protein